MVNELRDLMQQLVATPPEADGDLGAVLTAGRSRVRRRRRGLAAVVAAAATVAALAGAGILAGDDSGDDRVANQTVPRPEGPVLRVGDATAAVEGTDYDVLASYTNKDLDAANGQYYDGITDDGLILFRDGPHGPENRTRYALLDPATGEKDWLPAFDGQGQVFPVALGAERLVLVALQGMEEAGRLTANVYDRLAGRWTTMTWTGLPELTMSRLPKLGADGRLYVGVPATEGSPPPGGWPTGSDGEADDSGAEGDTYDLWSVSLDDPQDVRDERLRVGSFAFSDDALVWTDRTNGTNDRIHVRDLVTGEESDFDPRSGERCNVLSFGVAGDKIVVGQYCGDYDDGRDDRVQVLTMEGEPVTTVQGDGLGGSVSGDLVQVTSYAGRSAGTYVYEPDSGRFLRVSDGVSSYALGGLVPDGYLMWDTPVGEATDPQEPIPGATQWLVRWRS